MKYYTYLNNHEWTCDIIEIIYVALVVPSVINYNWRSVFNRSYGSRYIK